MAARYWVGGTATWNATAGSKWALTSGGAGGQAVPTSSDDVFFDAASGAVTITIGAGSTCLNFDATGFTGTIAGSSGWTIAGNFLLVAGLTFTNTSIITFTATSGTKTITTAGKTIGGITLNGVGGTWQLQDHLIIDVAKNLTLTNGTFDDNNKNVTAGTVASTNSNVRVFIKGTGIYTLTSTGSVWNFSTSTNLTFTDAGTSIVNDVSATIKNFNGGGKTFNILTVTGDNVTILQSSTFLTINNNTAGLTNGLVLGQGTTQTVTNYTTNGSVGSLAKMWSSLAGTAASLSKASGVVCVDYMSIKDITGTGGATFNMGSHSTNVSGNTGLNFVDCVTNQGNFFPFF